MAKRGGSSALAAMLKQRSEAGAFGMEAAPPSVIASTQLASVAETPVAPVIAPPPRPPPPTPVHVEAEVKPVAPLPPAVSSSHAPVPPHPAAHYAPKTTTSTGASKCCMCEKTVYKMEETIAVGRVWHNACFTCGGANSDGCKRTLHRDGYTDHDNQPYCNACYGKLFKPKGFGIGTGLNTDFGVHDAPASSASSAPVQPVPAVQSTPSKPAAPAPAVKAAPSTPPPVPAAAASTSGSGSKPAAYTPTNHVVVTNQTPKCTVCAKSVYKMEEMIAVGRVWHSACFTCGGTAKTHDGCGKVLHRDGYLDHDNQPYCNACYSKHFKPKGFSVGAGLNTDYGPTEAAHDVSKVHIDATAAPKPAAPPARAPAPAPVPAPAPTVQTLSNDDMNTKFHQAAILKSNVPQSKANIKIGASTSAMKDSDLHKESGYVGDNDEVDESEW